MSDGVFAFALTLLVVQLVVPPALTAHDSGELALRLLEQSPSYFSYVLSFAVIAMSWYGHHETFRHIRRYDGRLIALNFGNLLLIAVLPFPTAVLGRYGSLPIAGVVYALAVSLIGLLAAATWWYATHRRRLVGKELSSRAIRLRFYRELSAPAVFLVSIPIVLWSPYLAEAAWALLWTVLVFLLPRDRARTR